MGYANDLHEKLLTISGHLRYGHNPIYAVYYKKQNVQNRNHMYGINSSFSLQGENDRAAASKARRIDFGYGKSRPSHLAKKAAIDPAF